VSHDLRAPLRAIDGFSFILQESYADRLDAEGRRLIQVVRDGAQKMAQLIDDVLAYAHLARRELVTSVIDMNGLVEATLVSLQPAFTGRAIEMKVAPLPDTWGDREMIQRVWLNLLDNAIKFTARNENAAIEVGAYKEAGYTIYFVKDNGVGFSMEYVDKLFGVFQRLHGSEDFPGTGAGLAIVKRIVSRLGGRVWAEGKIGEGAAFYFAVPASESAHG
jgi:light-regulated signal transduction histidine kinase (bacteriophytochrome)